MSRSDRKNIYESRHIFLKFLKEEKNLHRFSYPELKPGN